MTNKDPEQLLTAVNAALEADTRIDIDDQLLELDVDGGVLTLDGSVNGIRAKRIAANVIWSVVKEHWSIRDRLNVRTQHAGELELRDKVVKSLSSEGMFSNHTLIVIAGSHRETIHQGTPGAGWLEAHVDGSVVTLKGETASLSHRGFAEVLIWWLAGCERVDNEIEIVPPDEYRDNDITDIVRMVLEKNPLVHAAQLRVGTAGAVVELEGLVASEEERRLAVLDAWYVPGVWDVIDRIEVRA